MHPLSPPPSCHAPADEYMGVPIVDDHYEEGPNVTRSLARRVNANIAENLRDNVSKQVLLLITHLEKVLRDLKSSLSQTKK